MSSPLLKTGKTLKNEEKILGTGPYFGDMLSEYEARYHKEEEEEIEDLDA